MVCYRQQQAAIDALTLQIQTANAATLTPDQISALVTSRLAICRANHQIRYTGPACNALNQGRDSHSGSRNYN